jgi:hypothetical protein
MASRVGNINECDGCHTSTTEKLDAVILYPADYRGGAGPAYDLCRVCFEKVTAFMRMLTHDKTKIDKKAEGTILDQLDAIRKERDATRNLEFDYNPPTPITRPRGTKP